MILACGWCRKVCARKRTLRSLHLEGHTGHPIPTGSKQLNVKAKSTPSPPLSTSVTAAQLGAFQTVLCNKLQPWARVKLPRLTQFERDLGKLSRGFVEKENVAEAGIAGITLKRKSHLQNTNCTMPLMPLRGSRHRVSGLTQRCIRSLSSAPFEVPAPPLLLKLRADMKAAMKAKDTNRYGSLFIMFYSKRKERNAQSAFSVYYRRQLILWGYNSLYLYCRISGCAMSLLLVSYSGFVWSAVAMLTRTTCTD